MNSVSTVTNSALACRSQKAASDSESAITVIGLLYTAAARLTKPRSSRPFHAHAPISHHHLRRTAPRRGRQRSPSCRLGPPQARPRPTPIHRSARPLRHHAMRDRHLFAAFRQGRWAAARKRDLGERDRGRALGGHGQSEAADRRDRAADQSDRCPVGGRAAAFPGERRCGLSRGYAVALSLPRSAARASACEFDAARAGDRLDPPPHDRAGFYRVPDADPHRELARGRARLSRAEPSSSGQVLRAAAGAAAIQATADGRGLRSLFPDRAVLPRRGEPRRPLARASSTSSISRCPLSRKTTSSRRSSR